MRSHGTGLVQKKSLGQVFLNTDWPVRRVVESLRSWGVQRVLEIGPGPGILTYALCDAGFHVTAVEKDERFAARLRENAPASVRAKLDSGSSTLEIATIDVLQFRLDEWVSAGTKAGAKMAVVGNIPYNISSPIILWALPYLSDLVGIQFMVQLEFAERIAAMVNTKDYGSLSVFTQLRAKVSLDFTVEKTCFTPVPKVDSAVISLRPLAEMLPADVLKKTETITRIAFTQRRKKLRNAVKPFIGDKSEDDCPVDLNRRAETLSPQEFIALAHFLRP